MMSTIQKITPLSQTNTSNLVTKTFQQELQSSQTTVRYARKNDVKLTKINSLSCVKSPPERKAHWQEKEYREAYMEAAIEQGIAWQIKLNRSSRGLSQKELAAILGKQQSAISRWEDPEYGSHSIEVLTDLAKAFDCALSVKFISYLELAYESERLSEADQIAAPFSSDSELFHG